MTIDWIHFTPWTSLFGGMLIGLAAALLLLCNGRIAGISGILGGLLPATRGDIAWRALVLLGLVLAPLAWSAVRPLPVRHIEAGHGMLVVAGLLVGIGTRALATTAAAAPAAMACAGWRGCRRVRSSLPAPSWRSVSSPCTCCAMRAAEDIPCISPPPSPSACCSGSA